jgi:FdhD protein
MMQGFRRTSRIVFGPSVSGQAPRALPEEVAIALTYNGSTQAVMMATPDALEDFAYGFSATEGIADPTEIESVEVIAGETGTEVRMWLSAGAEARLSRRRRTMAGPVGCGLCGIDSLAEAVRRMPEVTTRVTLSARQVMEAIAELTQHQPLEDVGRHNALDKLAGAMLRRGVGPEGALLLTSRVSVDLVQKCAAMRVPVLIAVSAPTSHAVEAADAAGITLVGLARADRFEVFTHPDRIRPEEAADVA